MRGPSFDERRIWRLGLLEKAELRQRGYAVIEADFLDDFVVFQAEAIGMDYTFARDAAGSSSKTLSRWSLRNLSLPNMDNAPQALTRKEIEEIAAMEDIRQMWGAESAAEMEGMLETSVYAVKFNYQSGGPGYVGDLYILLGDTPDEPLRLIRVKGELEILD